MKGGGGREVGKKNQSGKQIIQKSFMDLNWDSSSNGDNENSLDSGYILKV